MPRLILRGHRQTVKPVCRQCDHSSVRVFEKCLQTFLRSRIRLWMWRSKRTTDRSTRTYKVLMLMFWRRDVSKHEYYWRKCLIKNCDCVPLHFSLQDGAIFISSNRFLSWVCLLLSHKQKICSTEYASEIVACCCLCKCSSNSCPARWLAVGSSYASCSLVLRFDYLSWNRAALLIFFIISSPWPSFRPVFC